MDNRLELHERLLEYYPNVYFQPPENITMVYPCIVYNRTGLDTQFGNNKVYLDKQQYQLMVIEHDPDSDVSKRLVKDLPYCRVTQYYTVENLNHTTLSIYY